MADDPTSENPKIAARIARLLLRHRDRVALATILDGAPYASLALLAVDLDASPILLLSDLSRASRNLKADPRVSMLVASPENARDPLDSPRLSLIGRVEPTTDPRLRRRFLARHPESAMYVDFHDFRFYRIVVERAHFIGGFGVISWLEGRDLIVTDAAQALVGADEKLIDQLNRDMRDSLDLCVERFAKHAGSGWRVIGLDPDGIDLRCSDEAARLDFAALADDVDAVRTAVADLITTANQPSQS